MGSINPPVYRPSFMPITGISYVEFLFLNMLIFRGLEISIVGERKRAVKNNNKCDPLRGVRQVIYPETIVLHAKLYISHAQSTLRQARLSPLPSQKQDAVSSRPSRASTVSEARRCLSLSSPDYIIGSPGRLDNRAR